MVIGIFVGIQRRTLRGSSVFPIGFFFIALAMGRCMEAADAAASATHTHTHTYTHTHGVSRVFSLYWKYT